MSHSKIGCQNQFLAFKKWLKLLYTFQFFVFVIILPFYDFFSFVLTFCTRFTHSYSRFRWHSKKKNQYLKKSKTKQKKKFNLKNFFISPLFYQQEQRQKQYTRCSFSRFPQTKKLFLTFFFAFSASQKIQWDWKHSQIFLKLSSEKY